MHQIEGLRKTPHHVKSRVKRCRIVQGRICLWQQRVRALVMARCWALHTFRVRLTPW